MVKKSTLVAWSVILLPIAYLLTLRTEGFVSDIFVYYDELLSVFSVGYVAFLMYSKKLNNTDKALFYLLLTITGIGVISNIVSRVIGNVFAIAVDILALWKPFAIYLMCKHFAVNNRDNMIKAFVKISKLVIIVLAALSVIGQFVNIVVVEFEQTFFGIFKVFNLYGAAVYQVGWWLFGSLLMLAAANIPLKKFLIYLCIAFVPMFLTGATTVWGWMVIEAMLLLFIKRDKILKVRYLVPIAIVILAVAFVDISTYLLDDSAARFILFSGGFTVAKRYFPFGSGFATFGSDMAYRYYSKLYIEFGWKDLWGFKPTDGKFINDNLLASIIGQFGWGGTILYFICMFLVFKGVNSSKLNRLERITALSTILTLGISLVGSAAIKTSMGMFAFGVLGIIAAKTENSEKL